MSLLPNAPDLFGSLAAIDGTLAGPALVASAGLLASSFAVLLGLMRKPAALATDSLAARLAAKAEIGRVATTSLHDVRIPTPIETLAVDHLVKAGGGAILVGSVALDGTVEGGGAGSRLARDPGSDDADHTQPDDPGRATGTGRAQGVARRPAGHGLGALHGRAEVRERVGTGGRRSGQGGGREVRRTRRGHADGRAAQPRLGLTVRAATEAGPSAGPRQDASSLAPAGRYNAPA
ncbi:hypothetical protein [Methylobacterium fujisawaense]|jgi:hypothetical protein